MPINTEWYNNEQTILHIAYIGNWTLTEYHENIVINSQMISDQAHHVITLADFSQSGAIPSRFLSSGAHSENIVPANNVGIILYGINTYMAMLAKIFSKVFPKSSAGMMIASNEEEALQMAHTVLKIPQD